MFSKQRYLLIFVSLSLISCMCCIGIIAFLRSYFDSSFVETFEPLKPFEGMLSPPPAQVLKRVVGEGLIAKAKDGDLLEEYQVGAPRGTIWRWRKEKGRFHLLEPLELYDTPDKVVHRVFPLWWFATDVSSSSSLVPLRPSKGKVSRDGEIYFHIIYSYNFHKDFRDLVIATQQRDKSESLRFLAITYWDGDRVQEHITLNPAGVPVRRSVIYTESGSGREWHFEFVTANMMTSRQ